MAESVPNTSTATNALLTDRWFYGLATLGILLNLTGFFPIVIEPDGALYASIAKTMAKTSDFVNLMVQGQDWLDKPHFPFWVTAISFKLFGINSFAYKLPALLFFGAGVAYTYRFARLTYSKTVAQIATLVVLTPYHLVLSNNDVRAEPYLFGLTIGAVYHFFRVYWLGAYWHLLLACLLTACAIMTKGPFMIVPIGGGLVLHWILTGQSRELLKPRWWLAVALVLVFTLPELICLYLQFDLHPEKVVFGRTGVSGVQFFFWDSQFGRFFNTGPIKGAGDPFFFTHTLLWAFLPWSLLLYAAIGRAIYRFVRWQDALPEYVSIGSGLATFLLFSLSSFQLPHYLNIVFPFYAIITAHFLVKLRPEGQSLRRWTYVQTGLAVLLLVASGALVGLVHPGYFDWAIAWLVACAGLLIWAFRKGGLLALLSRTAVGALAAFGLLNLFIFPELLRYQAGSEAAFFINEHNQKYRPVAIYRHNFYSYDFFLQHPIQYYEQDSVLASAARYQPLWVFTDRQNADSLARKGFSVRPLAEFSYYHITKPSLPFLNAQTRDSVTTPYVVAEIRAH